MTTVYMAPEVHLGLAHSGQSVDLFAAAIILFIIITGRNPFDRAHSNDPMYYDLVTNPEVFWCTHASQNESKVAYSEEFRDLFVKMTSFDPSLRPTLGEVLSHPWMLGHLPSRDDV